MIHSFDYCIKKNGDTGTVFQTKGPLVMVSGLDGVVIGEGVTFETGQHGEVLSVSENQVEVLIFSREPVSSGTKVGRTGEQLSISVGEGLLGHVVDSLGYTLDTRHEDSIVSELRPIESRAKGITARRKVNKFLETGVSIVDLVVPLGLGQRELIIGDRKTGKTSFLLQSVISQAKKERVCIYVLIGKKKSEIKEIYNFLKSSEVMPYSIIVAASAEDSPGENYIAPYTGMTIAEYFRDQGTDTLVILDDLTSHAKYYREISLVGGRFPGRESYPGDIFYLHSKLLERAGNFEEASITCFPVAESATGDITGYIQTNLMSMTDGHLFFDSDLFFKGVRPAVNVFLSVTRVGKQTQDKRMRDVATKVLSLMKENEEMSRFLRFGPEVTQKVSDILRRGGNLVNFFNQLPGESRSLIQSLAEAERIIST